MSFFSSQLEELGSDRRSNLEGEQHELGHPLLAFTSEIRQPPITPSLLHSSQPLTQWIKQQHARDPAHVNDCEVEADSRRRIGPINWRLEQPLHRFASSPVQQDRDSNRFGSLGQNHSAAYAATKTEANSR